MSEQEPKIFDAKLTDLKPTAKNPRQLSEKGYKQLKKKMDKYPKFITAREVVIDEDFNILGGHQRVKVAEKRGDKTIRVKQVFGWTREEKDNFIISDNVSEGDWDEDILANEWDESDLSEWMGDELPNWEQTEYQSFVDKFKPKLTTDDCYTPPAVFSAVEKWVRKHYGLKNVENIRPFKPDGDYQKENYQNKVVIDNPPFSILAEIIRWYSARKIPFFLFAPYLTTLASAQNCQVTRVLTGAAITYENGAVVMTNFITNMDKPDVLVEVAGSLRRAIEEAQPSEAAELERYIRPKNLKVGTDFTYAAKNGTDWKMTDEEVELVKQSDYLKAAKKGLFGGGLLVSDRIAEKAAAEKAAIKVELSEREQKIVERLNGKGGWQDGTKTDRS